MKTLFKNCRIIDGLGGKIEKGWLLIEEDRISLKGEEGEVPQGIEAEVDQGHTINATGKSILPGLIDCHVHLTLDGSPDPMNNLIKTADPTATLQTARNADLTLKAGVTTVRDLGSKNFIDICVRDGIASGLIAGPRMLCAGQMICITGGHGWQVSCQADGPDEVRRAVRKQVHADVDVVKFMATGGVLTKGGRPGIPQLNPDELKAGIEEAHKVSLKTAAHSQGLEGTRNAVYAGIDSIEHGVSLDDEIIEEMIKRDVFLVPTLSAPINILRRGVEVGIPDEYVEKTKRVHAGHIEALLRAKKAGVQIVMGTDAGTPFNLHGENASELVYFVDNGFSAMEAILCATSRAAELLGIQDRVGSINSNMQADLLVVDGNPLEDISSLADPHRISAVYKGGKKVS